jgi:hypothetical protein
VRSRAKLAGFEKPPNRCRIDADLLNPRQQFFVIIFPLRTADNFANARKQYVHRPNGWAGRRRFFILFHVKGFDFARIIGQDDRFFKMLLNQKPLVFRLQVDTPANGILKFLFLVRFRLQ